MIEITTPPSPSRMKELALEEKEQEISKEIKEIITLQSEKIKEAMKKEKNFCSWIAASVRIDVNFQAKRMYSVEKRMYSVEAETEVRRIFTEAGYIVTKEKIMWEA